MRLSDLSEDGLNAIKSVRWDRIIEKHEGPDSWESTLKWHNPDFMAVDGRFVLLPIECDRHRNITILRTVWSIDHNSLTLFLKDTTYSDDWFMSGYMAVCDRMVDQDFYVAILYHEWFMIEPSSSLEA